MSKSEQRAVSFDEFDEINYPRPAQTDFARVVERVVSRRGFMGGGVALGASALVMGTSALTPTSLQAAENRFGFQPIPTNTMDTVTVPEGYSWHPVVLWGEPLWSDAADFDHTTRGTGESQERAFGDNTDGMALFHLDGKNILAVNNEYTNRSIIYDARETKLPENEDDVRKGKAAHGVTVVEIAKQDGKWQVVKDSPYNRRITADAPMEITGPAAGHDLLKTAADPTGTQSLGTWNNCGNGRTPWGTYLACEENFNGYFSSSDENLDPGPDLGRYGVGLKDWGYAWATADERFDISKHPNEPNRAGYIVEIDPLDPESTPKKRTALGRFKHENAEVVLAPVFGPFTAQCAPSGCSVLCSFSAKSVLSRCSVCA
ncbi:MAG: alkaline phosphatase PhoX, partial [Pseudomonadota bacterium]